MKPILFGSLCLALCASIQAARDPFWPIEYEPGQAVKPEDKTQDPPENPQTRALTDEEMRQLAREEQERIRNVIQSQGHMVAGDRIYVYLQNEWLTTGDSFIVEVRGKRYRLEITSLTKDNTITLKTHRATESPKP